MDALSDRHPQRRQSFGIAFTLAEDYGGVAFVSNPGLGFILMTMLTLTTGSVFIMWLGEQITERGIGNGMSLLIFAGIVVGLPRGVVDLYDKVQHRCVGSVHRSRHDPADCHDGRGRGVHRLCGALRASYSGAICQASRGTQSDGRAIDALAVESERGRRHAGHLRFIDSDVAADAGFVLQGQPILWMLLDKLKWGEPMYELFYAVGIIFFAYFYVSIVFNPNEVADNMRKYGGFIPGIRPGKRTADNINEILTRITLVGALYLILISFIPEWMIAGIQLNHLPGALGASLSICRPGSPTVWA